MSMRVGTGYDVHRLVEGRKLILGGVEIPYEKGLLGHSDADVILHAIMDALLGAAALGDIGQHFPDKDPAYEGISSLKLLGKVAELLDEHVLPASDASECCRYASSGPFPGQHQGNDGGGAWIHRKWRWHRRTGSLLSLQPSGRCHR